MLKCSVCDNTEKRLLTSPGAPGWFCPGCLPEPMRKIDEAASARMLGVYKVPNGQRVVDAGIADTNVADEVVLEMTPSKDFYIRQTRREPDEMTLEISSAKDVRARSICAARENLLLAATGPVDGDPLTDADLNALGAYIGLNIDTAVENSTECSPIGMHVFRYTDVEHDTGACMDPRDLSRLRDALIGRGFIVRFYDDGFSVGW